MLSFYESYQKRRVPEALNGEVHDLNGPIEIIEEFRKVNIFIGPNNSGKSIILRELLKERLAKKRYNNENSRIISKKIGEFVSQIKYYCSSELRLSTTEFYFTKPINNHIFDLNSIISHMQVYEKVNENFNAKEVVSYLKDLSSSHIDIDPNLDLVIVLNHAAGGELSRIDGTSAIAAINHFNQLLLELKISLENYIFFEEGAINKLYIPSIRSLRDFGIDFKMETVTINEYKFTSDVDVYNGQKLPERLTMLRNGIPSQKKRLELFQDFLSETFFNNEKVELTVRYKETMLNIKIGDEQEQPVHKLGDGLQMLIILTFPFFDLGSGFIVIEEPELFIHPGLQKKYVSFLVEHSATQNFQIFISTHSNHIVDSINSFSKISLFSVRKNYKVGDNSYEKLPNFILENIAIGDQNLLNLLGISNTSVYLSNCTIWVEGITDKIYLQAFLKKYLANIDLGKEYSECRNFQEGIHYSFALSGGDNIVHWDFSDDKDYEEKTKNIIVKRFCGKSFVIVDRDFGKNSSRKRILEELLGDRFYELKVPEIENLLTPKILKSVLLKYESLKKRGVEQVSEIDKEILGKYKLGYIIDEFMLKGINGGKRFSISQDKASSLKSSDKYQFCLYAVESLEDEELSNGACDLIQKMLLFILAQNRK